MVSSFLLVLPLLSATLSNALDHRVVVGGPGLLAYTPPSIQAKIGDTITFEFHEKNHTATQSSFDSPCSPLYGGFDSGFRPVAPGTQYGFPTYTITVNDSKPIWAHCRQPGPPPHCQEGMVFAANAPEYGNTFEAFRNKAKALKPSSTYSTTPTSTQAASTTSTHVASTTTVSHAISTTTVTITQTVTTTVATASSTPVTHKIVVGGTKDGAPLLAFTPPTVKANVGDWVEFEFQVKNHTVTQSPFSNPCTKLEAATYGTQIGFDSGFMPVAPNATVLPTFKIKVNSTAPIWGYCRQQGHCVQGMVFGINAPEYGPNTFAAFQQLAIHSNVTASLPRP